MKLLKLTGYLWYGMVLLVVLARAIGVDEPSVTSVVMGVLLYHACKELKVIWDL